MTGDDKPDIVVNNAVAEVIVLENVSSTALAFRRAFPGGVILGDGYFGLAVADFNGDGGKDLAAARSDRDEVYILQTSTVPFPVSSPMNWLPLILGGND